mmetsp:Transcript_32484/g.85276  ORF Transcript_32484/g.85276 Transcript_32484/m.85276 type:complete len:328 (+) Transcript_32484:1379-2362(+)
MGVGNVLLSLGVDSGVARRSIREVVGAADGIESEPRHHLPTHMRTGLGMDPRATGTEADERWVDVERKPIVANEKVEPHLRVVHPLTKQLAILLQAANPRHAGGIVLHADDELADGRGVGVHDGVCGTHRLPFAHERPRLDNSSVDQAITLELWPPVGHSLEMLVANIPPFVADVEGVGCVEVFAGIARELEDGCFAIHRIDVRRAWPVAAGLPCQLCDLLCHIDSGAGVVSAKVKQHPLLENFDFEGRGTLQRRRDLVEATIGKGDGERACRVLRGATNSEAERKRELDRTIDSRPWVEVRGNELHELPMPAELPIRASRAVVPHV